MEQQPGPVKNADLWLSSIMTENEKRALYRMATNPTKSVNYCALNIYLLRAVQQLSQTIETLTARVVTLEG